MPGFASRLAALRGDYVTADRLAHQSESAAAEISLPPDAFGMAEPVATLAEIALEQGRFDEAEACIDRLMRIVDNGRRPIVEMFGHLLSAQLASATNDDVVVGVHLERARAVLPDATAVMIEHIDIVELRHALRRHDRPTATLLLDRLTPSPLADLLAVRLRLFDDDAAIDTLRTVSDLATPRLRIEHAILCALASARRDADVAQRSLHDALELADTMGYRQTILDEGPALWDLLRCVRATGRLGEYVAGLLHDAAGSLPPTRAKNQFGLLEPLSDRELTVLRYLSSRLTGTEIATALYL
jgi:LuxR family transcriptional regulator, maltose regulon positive regulatory protein